MLRVVVEALNCKVRSAQSAAAAALWTLCATASVREKLVRVPLFIPAVFILDLLCCEAL